MNCWEFKKCGREHGGKNVKSLGVCPASTEKRADGINRGKNGGRACWAIAGTLCRGMVQGGFGDKAIDCMRCRFYKQVWIEERGGDYKLPNEILEILEKADITRNVTI